MFILHKILIIKYILNILIVNLKQCVARLNIQFFGNTALIDSADKVPLL